MFLCFGCCPKNVNSMIMQWNVIYFREAMQVYVDLATTAANGNRVTQRLCYGLGERVPMLATY